MEDLLHKLAAWQAKSALKQYMHAFANGGKDEKVLSNLLDRLGRAKADLNIRILTAHVGLSGTMRDGFVAALPVVQRIDRNVQRILGQRLSIATWLESDHSSRRGKAIPTTLQKANAHVAPEDGTVHLNEADVRALNL